ncbi:hypothetical protein QBC37DRAFT_373916 [Rhypophila decipiens]|uniref:Uncharacterized protein n=1 Tax=Rhypophila decipiens TaxID=261697 RepID=A0AAN6Y6U7_9PEZI|nr:hypothetical protein QBC37DRAFT_373916 [Rhypophila decipiens]
MASTASRRSGVLGWRWPPGEERAEHTSTVESFTDRARPGPGDLRYLGLSIRVCRIVLFVILLLIVILFVTLFGVQTSALLKQAIATNKVIDMNCSTNQAPATYVPRLHRDSIFSIYCSRDISTHDLFDIITPDFEACMDSCSNQRYIATGTTEIQQANQSSLSRPCEAVTFVPQLLNTTLALEWEWGGNCFLKYGPLSTADLKPNPRRGGDEFLCNAAIILS